MSWNYRLVDYGSHMAVHEVYYDKEGKITGLTETPRTLTGDSVDDIEEDLKLILEQLRRHPPLSSADLPS